MAIILSYMNQKGGVGKTSLCWNTAVYLSHKFGKKVLVIDLDTQGNISTSLTRNSPDYKMPQDCLTLQGIEAKELFLNKGEFNKSKIMHAMYGIDLIFTRSNDLSLLDSSYQKIDGTKESFVQNEAFVNFAVHLNEITDNYDYILMDCPPYIAGYIQAALVICDYVITPIQPTAFVLEGAQGFFNQLDYIGRRNIFLGMVANNIDKRFSRHLNLISELRTQLGELVYDTVIYHRAPIDSAIFLDMPLWDLPNWKTAQDEMEKFVRETIQRIDKNEGTTTELKEVI